MSRSYRKSPCAGITTARSDKPFKIEVNRKLRHNVNQSVRELVKKPELADEVVLPKVDEIVNQYDSPKDGKSWLGKYRDTDWYKKLMRK